MGNCCKKRDEDEDSIKQSPLICEDLEGPSESTVGGSATKSKAPLPKKVVAGHPGRPGVEMLLSSTQIQQEGSNGPTDGKTPLIGNQSGQNRNTNLDKSISGSAGEAASDTSVNRSPEMDDSKVYEKVGDHFVVRSTNMDAAVVDEAKVKTFITSREHNPFFDKPLDFSQRTIEDFEKKAFLDQLVEKMEEGLRLFEAILELGTQGFELLYDDVKNETGVEMKIYGHTVSTSKNHKIHATKQFFKLKCKPEEFIFVSNDQDIQNRINTNLLLYKNWFTKKTPTYTLELFHSKSKKIMMIDSRESIFIKYCKAFPDGRVVSIGKSILLSGLNTEGEDLTTNIQLTGFQYTLHGEDPQNVYSEVKAYNSTDFCSAMGLMILKPMIIKNVKELIKKNMEEIETLRVSGHSFPPLPKCVN